MSSWRDVLKLSSCMWFDQEQSNRNSLCALISGLLFFTGWWLIIDANVVYQKNMYTSYYIWGILGTVSWIMVNAVREDADLMQSQTPWISTWLFVAFVMGFASVIASFWIFFQNFKDVPKVPGIELLLQNVLIFLSSLLFKFGREHNPTF